MPKRIFIGIKPSDEIKHYIGELQEEFSYLPMHWVPLENLHITIVPPWKPENFESSVRLFKTLKIPQPEDSLCFSKTEFNAKRNYLRAVGDTPASLVTLAEQLHAQLGRPQEERKLLMHITLAKHVAPELQLPEIKLSWEFVPQSVTMFESIQRDKGTDYGVIHELPFTDIENGVIL